MNKDDIKKYEFLSESHFILSCISNWPHHSAKILKKFLSKSICLYVYMFINKLYIYIHPRMEIFSTVELLNVKDIYFNKLAYTWYSEIPKEIKKTIFSLPFSNFILSGFGTGGVVSQYLCLAFSNYDTKKEKKILCYNFGSPSPGNNTFSITFEKLNINLISIILNDDKYHSLINSDKKNYEILYSFENIMKSDDSHNVDVYLHNIYYKLNNLT